ncbi:hypothetical protein EUTSA_v10002309mg [Eutrema salsugineum]|uniref:2Fe-2S ferredoxin-type domain-containing protein n=1 Tax=Eutrema salsugineum TaxID=72664 RepID=V4MC86_EUTSA|nr:hypothetical protein EUTSA_v10002309mg [Eutrema salsugineum]
MSIIFKLITRLTLRTSTFELDLSSVDLSTTLLEFLRYQTPFKSVKLSCGEGGCGACVVLLSKYNPILKTVKYLTVSSCLTLLCNINHCSITTSEGLGNSRDGFHLIHNRFSGFHAYQCNFCTPGMCVSLYSALLDSEKTESSSEFTVLEAEKAVSGNLCWCTGYRPIGDACKSFASDVDIEDLGFNSFCKKGDSNKSLPRFDSKKRVCTFLEFLKDEIKSTDSGMYRWCSPASANGNGVSMKLVAGNTGTRYYKDEREHNYDKYIDITRIPEMKAIRENKNGVEIGAVVTISKVIAALKVVRVSPRVEKMFGKLATHMEKIAARFIRNFGSIGGNLVMAQRKQFPYCIWCIGKDTKVINCRLVFGAYGTKDAIRCKEVKEFLYGKVITENVLYEAITLLGNIVLFSSHTTEKTSNGYYFDPPKPLPMLSSTQIVPVNDEFYPIGEPVTKSGASLQASGEPVYPYERIKCIHFKENSVPDSVLAIISYKNDPKGRQNVGMKFAFSTEPLFAEEVTTCVGKSITLVVADTQRHADIAANVAVVTYETEDLELPILSTEEVVKKSIGDTSKGMAEADHRVLSLDITLGSQYFFYMETQTALAMPDEDNSIVVYSSCQTLQYVHSTVAACLGILKTKSVATAWAVAANKLQRPMRTYVNRKTDMIMTGGRHPMKITYSVGFRSTGKITDLELEILIDDGATLGLSMLMPSNIIGALKKYKWGALSFDFKLCKTNLLSKAIMRAPGDVQGTYIAEAIIKNVASTLSLEADTIRKIKLHTYKSLAFFYKDGAGEPHEYTLSSMWDEDWISSVRAFNESNIWRKRGISRVPITYEVSMFATPGRVSVLSDGSIVVELVGKIRVVQSDTLSMVQGNFTGGSTTSERSCSAVCLCCETLVERLKPLKKTGGPISWNELISQAYAQSMNLSASDLYTPEETPTKYLNYGVAVSEVEVDFVTEKTTVLQTDILYDCGKSLNPAVNLGQYITDSDGLVVTDSTWSYKIPTIDIILRQFNVETLNSSCHEKRVLSSNGQSILQESLRCYWLNTVLVHCATREAIKVARKQRRMWKGEVGLDSMFQLSVPATMPVV